MSSVDAQATSEPGLERPHQIVLDAREEFYDVTGATVAEIYASIRKNVPAEVRPYFAKHEWGLEWEFEYAVRSGSCEILDAQMQLTSTTILPELKPASTPPAGLLHDWDRFMRGLREHERGHQQLAVDAARAVRKALRGLRTDDCASISSDANAVAEKVLEAHLEIDRSYDVQTKHGRTQGATWPPAE